MCTVMRPLSTSGRPCTVNGIVSKSPSSYDAEYGFCAGMPAGFASAIVRLRRPCGSRPSRPATIGRVDGLTCHSNARRRLQLVLSVSPELERLAELVPKSFSQRGRACAS